MSLPHFSVKNQVLVNMMMLVVLVGGVLFAFQLVKEVFPEFRVNVITVTAVYPGAKPEEIEKAITEKIEEAVRDISEIEKIDSTVNEGFSNTVLTIYSSVKDLDPILQEVKNEVDGIADKPVELENILVRKVEPKLPVVNIAVYGEGDEADRKRAARNLKDDLLKLPGISDVSINGSRLDEISIEIIPEKLRKFDITFDEIATSIRNANVRISGGTLKGDKSHIGVVVDNEKTRGRDLEDFVLRTLPGGAKIKLSDVANIRDDFVESDLESYFNGKPSMDVVVFKTNSQDAIQISNIVKAYVAGKQGIKFDPYGFEDAYAQPWYKKPFSLSSAFFSQTCGKIAATLNNWTEANVVYQRSAQTPLNHNFKVAIHNDLAKFVVGRLDLMTRNGKTGLILVVISLILFLNWRVAFWSAVGLPVAFMGTFIVMWLSGTSLNLLSLFGLIIVLGIIVDDAIVIGENIFRHVENGMDPEVAAVKGAEEVMWPVTIAVLTTIAAFTPLFFIRGQIGDFMGQLPTVVLAALSVSLIEALLILPAHLSHLPSKKKRRKSQQHNEAETNRKLTFLRKFRNLQEGFIHTKLNPIYERFLRFTLKWRYVTLSVAIALMIAAAGMVSGEIVETVFIQKMDSETLVCAIEMPVGTNADRVKENLQKLADLLTDKDKYPEVKNVQSYVGAAFNITGAASTNVSASLQSHLGQLIIELEESDTRERLGMRSSEELMTKLRKFSERLPGINSVTWQALSGGPGGKDIFIKVTGNNMKQIVAIGERLKDHISGIEGVHDLDDDFDKGKREARLRLRKSAKATGITEQALGRHVRAALFGREAQRVMRNREDVKIVVRYPERFRKNVFHLEEMWIPNTTVFGQRKWIPFSQVAEITESTNYATLKRSQQQRAVSVFAAVDQSTGTKPSEVIAQAKLYFDTYIRPKNPDVDIEFKGQAEQIAKSFGSLKLAFPIALLMIYLLLAGLFRSYVQPIVVMSAIPFGFLGAVMGHWLTNNPMTILSAIGLVALTGIVVNDSLVLVSFINTRVRNGAEPFEASIDGAKLRLRAILLTTLTTVAGLTPLMFETSFQAKFLIPMAVTLTFGLIFATALTLLIVPTLNMIYFDFRRMWNKKEVEDEDEFEEDLEELISAS